MLRIPQYAVRFINFRLQRIFVYDYEDGINCTMTGACLSEISTWNMLKLMEQLMRNLM